MMTNEENDDNDENDDNAELETLLQLLLNVLHVRQRGTGSIVPLTRFDHRLNYSPEGLGIAPKGRRPAAASKRCDAHSGDVDDFRRQLHDISVVDHPDGIDESPHSLKIKAALGACAAEGIVARKWRIEDRFSRF